jgi:hypothetical protein
MSAPNTPGNGPRTVGQRIDEAIELIEMELRHAITYVNDAVIPQVRRESITAMRMTADTLRELADRFDRQSSAAANQSGSQTPGQTRGQAGNQGNSSDGEPRS